jgi:3-(3-hydroxy-phenyl)propionate hydroxylase
MKKIDPIIISGGGPVAAVLGLALWRQEIPVIILEREAEPVMDQRAASNHPPTIEMLVSLGLEDILEEGLKAPKYRIWDRETRETIVEFDLSELSDEFAYPFVLQFEQYKTVRKILELFGEQDGFSFLFSHEVISLDQHLDHVDVTVKLPDGTLKIFRASYLVGCDGASSTVRKEANIDYLGFTYDENFIKIGTYFDFGAIPGVQYRNFWSDPGEWCNLFKVNGEAPMPPIWRGVFPMRKNETAAQARTPEAIQSRLQRFFPKAGEYEIAYANVYTVHQRVAETFRKGRVVLAGDAAHANNPIGGMGLNGGIHDAMNLADKLGQIWRGEADEKLLTLYSKQRHKAAKDFIQQQTIANKNMMEDNDQASRKRRFDKLREIGKNRDLRRDYMRKAQLIDSLEAAAKTT